MTTSREEFEKFAADECLDLNTDFTGSYEDSDTRLAHKTWKACEVSMRKYIEIVYGVKKPIEQISERQKLLVMMVKDIMVQTENLHYTDIQTALNLCKQIIEACKDE